jgi:hypothetical protein
MAQSTFPAPSVAATLKQTITTVGTNTVTIPASNGLVYCRMVNTSNPNVSYCEGWVLNSSTAIINASYTCYGQLYTRNQANIQLYY